MSQINKDTIITQCANGYRMATGTSNPIKYGELGTLISTLSNGVTIGDITYNNNGTITITEDDSITTHTLATTYTSGVLTALTYDGNNIALTYDANGNLTALGNISINISEHVGEETLDNTVKFVVEDNTYQIVSVNAGDSISQPVTPTLTTGFVAGWKVDNQYVSFPYTPSGDVEVIGNIQVVDLTMGLSTSGLRIATIAGVSYTKITNDFSYFGVYLEEDGYTGVFSVSESQEPQISWMGQQLIVGSLTYNNTLYYYSSLGSAQGGDHRNRMGYTDVENLQILSTVYTGHPSSTNNQMVIDLLKRIYHEE